ncbi:sugar ABC transporter [Gracilibacillus boraciitolerans JCM 21714]|uniref:Sugar ABC transporter n=1 Tax=Gracilibacillus boraciitolerans JCM 21714 TaxID=1298598 RepID=W4VQP8_9BACI|nr:ABC transporter substrate-binding protein [Gracilibacillus boraciitolerans]GAE95263.1 sugar ABC transporter [Gracilibacillus boraciitolerans JCM 21714]
MKKLISWILLFVLLVLVSWLSITNLIFNEEEDLVNTQTFDKTSTEKTKLKLWFYYEGPERFNKVIKLINDFNQSNSKIEITAEYIPFSQMRKQLIIAQVSGELPNLVIIDNPYHAEFSEMGLFADITEQVNTIAGIDQFFEVPMNTVTYNEKIYGLPFAINSIALFYNKEMLENANVPIPETRDELRIAAKKLTNENTKGIGISALQNEEGVFQYLAWLYSAGGKPTDLDSTEAIESFQFLSNLISDGSMSKEVINWTQADLLKQFMEGNTAMMINGSWQIPELKSLAPELEYGVAFIPKDKVHATVLGGENLAVINGENIEESVEFIKYYAQTEVMESFVKEIGNYPPRKDVANDSTWTNDSIQKVFSENMKYALPRGPSPEWSEISKVISNALNKALTKEEEIEKITTEAQLKINKVLAK